MNTYTPKSRKGSRTSSRYSSDFPAPSRGQQRRTATGANTAGKKGSQGRGTGREKPPRAAGQCSQRPRTAAEHRATVWAAQRGETTGSVTDSSTKQGRRAPRAGQKHQAGATEHERARSPTNRRPTTRRERTGHEDTPKKEAGRSRKSRRSAGYVFVVSRALCAP